MIGFFPKSWFIGDKTAAGKFKDSYPSESAPVTYNPDAYKPRRVRNFSLTRKGTAESFTSEVFKAKLPEFELEKPAIPPRTARPRVISAPPSALKEINPSALPKFPKVEEKIFEAPLGIPRLELKIVPPSGGSAPVFELKESVVPVAMLPDYVPEITARLMEQGRVLAEEDDDISLALALLAMEFE